MQFLAVVLSVGLIALPLLALIGLGVSVITVNMSLAIISSLALAVYAGSLWLFVPFINRKNEEIKRENVRPIRK